MSPDERLAQLEARLAAAEARIAQLEMRGAPFGPIPFQPRVPSIPPYFDPSWIVTCDAT